MTFSLKPKNLLDQPFVLPCGAIIKNRLIKSAMSDSLADGEGNPTDRQIRLYERWAEGGVGLSIIGEVQIDPKYPETPGNLVLDPQSNGQALRALTSRASVNDAHIWAQLGHAGALAYQPLSQVKGPSALKIGDFECLGMSEQEVSQLPEMYAKAAKIAKDAGFTGVQIHAGHGFLLSQFLSPLFNRRTDLYGGTVEARSRIIVDILHKLRFTLGDRFPIGIKINSSDQLDGGLTSQEALEVIRILDQTSVDLIEISGGSYFPGAKASSDAASNGPYFVDFAMNARNMTKIPLVVTGGFKTCEQVLKALSAKCADFVGLGRAFILEPELARDWTKGIETQADFPTFKSPPSGGVTAWYTMALSEIANDREREVELDLSMAIQAYEDRDKRRVDRWRAKFQ
ncbi:oxidoreductase [Marinomonas posidonica]|uniref:NADH:flavin oxidoreductase/NADH oxidase n=1 Tax=Marinomonas posidonica (strain CECT 7376 / NCIMB 14433 / IVIA-Po-181) TaxID=491952 RepID=F6CWQ1_MARPP|nr:oxidoreductase [Marinomonas posidonica]AEF54401.1 NADH:flavin oxidoreductase/NADH oxidase [Marinomonas posidonica IVIA-Po-181]